MSHLCPRLESGLFRLRQAQEIVRQSGKRRRMAVSEGFQGARDLYSAIASSYADTRREDPRIAALIHQALNDAESVVNVGAGTGAYEPRDRRVVAVEPSEHMIAGRPSDLSPAVRAYAESLPLEAESVDAAMACMTLHHWGDWRVGVQEMRRVARQRIVIFTYDPSFAERFWLVRDYLPELGALDCRRFPTLAEQCAAAGEFVDVIPVPIHHDCHDGFLAAFWRRPHAYLDARVRANMSSFHLPGAAPTMEGLRRLAEDLRSGDWHRRNHDLLELEQLDLGYRLIVADLWARNALASDVG